MKRFSVLAIVLLVGCGQDNGVSQQPNKTLEPLAVVRFQDDAQVAKPAPTGPENENSKETAAPDAPTVKKRAIVLLNQGKVEEAERLLRERLQAEAPDDDARILLGRVLDFDGRPEEAVKIWKEGISGGQADFALWMHIGDLLARQGDDGPTLTRRRGTMTAQPDRDKEASAKFKKEHLEMAVEAYAKGVELAPTDAAASARLAQTQFALGNHSDAIATWQRLTEQNEQSVEAIVGLAKSLHASGKADEAIAASQKALKLNPRLSEIHALLAECQKVKGLDAEAKQCTRRAEFFAALPPFTELTFSEENWATLQGLNDKPTVERLCADASEQATGFLAALCWSHPHNDLEEIGFASLEKRGSAALPLIRLLFDHAQSTCTIRSAARILAAQKEPGLFDRLVRLLPGDTRNAGFDMDIAGALDALGDVRAVPHLVQILDPGARTEVAHDSPERFLNDRTMARARAAMALGAFDTAESRRALEASLSDSQLAIYCQAALYRMTRDQKYLEAFKQPITRETGYAMYVLIPYFKKLQTKEGTELVEELSKRLDEKRKEIDQKEAQP